MVVAGGEGDGAKGVISTQNIILGLLGIGFESANLPAGGVVVGDEQEGGGGKVRDDFEIVDRLLDHFDMSIGAENTRLGVWFGFEHPQMAEIEIGEQLRTHVF